MIVIVMGVAGSGKTTVGQALAAGEGWPFFDADDFHSPENKEKMRSGQGLTDEERRPWLLALRAKIDELRGAGRSGVFACSALKQAYRDHLQAGPEVRFVHLTGPFEVIARRLAERPDHYAGPTLLRSQFEALEPPTGVPTVDVSLTREQMLAATRAVLGLA
jgi:gluconokinase